MDNEDLTPSGYFSEFTWHSFDEDDAGATVAPAEEARLVAMLPDTPEPDQRPLERDHI